MRAATSDVRARRSWCAVRMGIEVPRKKRMRAENNGECDLSPRACACRNVVKDMPEDVALAILLHAAASRLHLERLP